MSFEVDDVEFSTPVFHMPWFPKGMDVEFQGQPYKVESTRLRRHMLLVKLSGVSDLVDSEKLTVRPTPFSLARMK